MKSETVALRDERWIVERGYEPVVDAFRANFASRGELGAAVAVYVHDKLVLDLWAGHRDRARTRPWDRDTIAPVFSSTKGVAALVVAALVSCRRLDYDRPVADYWEEFAAHGKATITVRQLLDHEAGVPALDRPVRLSELSNLDAVAAVLADQVPAWKPGTRHGYHPMTVGLYLRELIRRVDPLHRTLGEYFADEFAHPLDLDFHIGLPPNEQSAAGIMSRVAELSPTPTREIPRYERDFALGVVASMTFRHSLTRRAMNSPAIELPPHQFAQRAFLEQENPAAGGVGTARALARLYSLSVADGTAESRLPITTEVLRQIASPPTCRVPDWDLTLKNSSRYHLGMRKPCRRHFRIGTDDRAFGTTGLGGSVGFADPATGIGFGYIPTRLGWALVDDVRARALRQAVQKCLDR